MIPQLIKPLLYNSKTKIKIFSYKEDIWISLYEMSKLLEIDEEIIQKHLNDILKNEDLNDILICKKFIETNKNGLKEEKSFYNLDVILCVGYDLSKEKSFEFKEWIEVMAKEITIKGFTPDKEKIKKYKNTPLDYTDNRIWIYLELGGKKDLTPEYMLEIIDFLLDESQIIEVKYGFNLFICNQQIPEIVRILGQENRAIYQIARVESRVINN